MRTVGVEEEYLLVRPDGEVVGLAGAVLALAAAEPDDGDEPAPSGWPGHRGVLPPERRMPHRPDEPGGDLEGELKEQMIETGTRPCTDLAELREEIGLGRSRATSAAHRAGAEVAALGTAPPRVVPTLSPGARYSEINREFALTAREQLTCGCHVHVGIADAEEGVAVLDRIAPWLPVLLAISGNSPFWNGEDSGYASFRSQVWNRWPTAGPVPAFGSAAEYQRVVSELIATGAILDTGMIYFDARLSARYPTVEVRIADVCLQADDAALLAALVRGLVETAARSAAAGEEVQATRVEQLRAASWRAARSGLRGSLVSPVTFRPLPAREVVQQLLAHVRDVLEDYGDLEPVTELLEGPWRRGTGATRQRAWLAESGDLQHVVRRAAALTAR
ncbi:glutamate--cysteine ligase [Actinotalea ferrariae]|uniref:carboxylate-amine ligase n=1 Tax=Actinotalea ferrariae TaxID=1386098 RepID=UPI001C8BD146|nr:glutamate--cysteine ligase [Actinotalea ferrariae]MBX9243884.1 glutamate--cysteine ligase [Actinotalea ferrariae]